MADAPRTWTLNPQHEGRPVVWDLAVSGAWLSPIEEVKVVELGPMLDLLERIADPHPSDPDSWLTDTINLLRAHSRLRDNEEQG
jgi:hypothetical protein